MEAVGLLKTTKLATKNVRIDDEVEEVNVAQIALEVTLDELDRDGINFLAAKQGQTINISLESTWKPRVESPSGQVDISTVTTDTLPEPEPTPVVADKAAAFDNALYDVLMDTDGHKELWQELQQRGATDRDIREALIRQLHGSEDGIDEPAFGLECEGEADLVMAGDDLVANVRKLLDIPEDSAKSLPDTLGPADYPDGPPEGYAAVYGKDEKTALSVTTCIGGYGMHVGESQSFLAASIKPAFAEAQAFLDAKAAEDGYPLLEYRRIPAAWQEAEAAIDPMQDEPVDESVTTPAETSPQAGARYLDDKGELVFVALGLGGTTWGSFRHGASAKSLHRVVSSAVPMRESPELAQADLDAYAKQKGWRVAEADDWMGEPEDHRPAAAAEAATPEVTPEVDPFVEPAAPVSLEEAFAEPTAPLIEQIAKLLQQPNTTVVVRKRKDCCGLGDIYDKRRTVRRISETPMGYGIIDTNDNFIESAKIDAEYELVGA